MNLKRKILSLFVVGLILAPRFVRAEDTAVFYNRLQTIVGTIESKSRNNLLIYDDTRKVSERFVLLRTDGDRWKVGDRVRVYYSARDRVISNIKKMRRIERTQEQNAGIFFKAEDN